jgi:hypothetical protein
MKNKSIVSYLFGSLVTMSTLLTQGCSSAALESRLQQTNQAQAKTHYTGAITELAYKAKSIVDAGMKEFNEDTLPHEAKELRKQIVRLRDLLDVFPHNFAHELELWDDVRDGLDDGYTVVGDYKDLFDTNPDAVRELEEGAQPEYKDKKKLNERRKKVLKWKSDYFTEGGVSDQVLRLFLDIRELDASNVLNSKKYSSFFWGGVKAQPISTAKPAENARRLIDAQAAVATKEHPDVLNIKDPTTHENELLFHDQRKRLRTIAKVCNVANALTSGTCNTAAVKDVESLVVDLGEIEDLIITGRHLEEDGEKKKAEEAYEDAQKKFKKLKKKYEDKDMLEPLKRI